MEQTRKTEQTPLLPVAIDKLSRTLRLIALGLLVAGQVLAFTPVPPDQCVADDWAPPPPPPERERGVAFVHGTADHSQFTAHYYYWTDEMIDSVRSGLEDPLNYRVVGCDFEQNFWHPDMVDCLAEQLGSFLDTGINDLVVYTHSHGGNALRWILSNPSQDPSFPRIISNIGLTTIIAPSSKGTPLADMAISGTKISQWLGSKFGFDNDATAQQQTFMMDVFNQQNLLGTSGRPPLPIGFWTLTGRDVKMTKPRCASYWTVLGLRATHGLMALKGHGCNDGLLPCWSQKGAGIDWAEDYEITGGRELNHDVSRHACFGLDIQLRDDLAQN